MDYILVKFANFLIAICVASTVALTLGFVAHYRYGLSRLDIRTSALTGAAPDLWGRFHLADPPQRRWASMNPMSHLRNCFESLT